MSALHLALVLFACLEQHSQHFNGRIEAEGIGSSPTLDSGDSNAGLEPISNLVKAAKDNHDLHRTVRSCRTLSRSFQTRRVLADARVVTFSQLPWLASIS